MIKLKIDVKKIDKAHMFEGKKGSYLDLALFTNRDGTDQYGNDGFIVQEISKEARERGDKGPIIGNWKDSENKGQDRTAAEGRGQKQVTRETQPDDDCDDVPF